jgi:hypothetical protein
MNVVMLPAQPLDFVLRQPMRFGRAAGLHHRGFGQDIVGHVTLQFEVAPDGCELAHIPRTGPIPAPEPHDHPHA